MYCNKGYTGYTLFYQTNSLSINIRTLLIYLSILYLFIVFSSCWPIPSGTSPIPFNQSYALLQRSLDGGYYLTTSKLLKFKYIEEYHVSSSNDKLSYKIYDRLQSIALGVDNQSTPLIIGSPLMVKKQGDNRYDIDLSSFGLTTGNYYILVVENEKNEKRYLRFKLD